MITLSQKTELLEWMKTCPFNRIIASISDHKGGRCAIGAIVEYFNLDKSFPYDETEELLGISASAIWKINDRYAMYTDTYKDILADGGWEVIIDDLWDVIPTSDEIDPSEITIPETTTV